MKIYFAHPINFYGTLAEEYLLRRIKHAFPKFEIENPALSHHQIKCDEYKARGENVMNYFFKELLPRMDAGVCFAFPEDKMFGAGVYGEAEWLHNHGKPIYEVTLNGTIDELVLNEARRLSVQDTRARLKKKYR